MATALDDILARWDSGEGKPFKGRLIDFGAYAADPDNIGCMCAQGQVLHLLGGYSPQKLRDTEQEQADREAAKLLGISIAHSILLRSVNDSVDGAPSIVLTHPEKVLGSEAQTVLAFWRHLDRMTDEDWLKVDAAWAAAWAAAGDAAGGAAWAAAWAARAAAGDAAWAAAWAAKAAAGDAAWAAAWAAAGDAAGGAARAAAWAAAGVVAGVAAGDAGYACSEIQGAALMRERGQPFFFLPMFGFADPEAVLAAEAK
jgi:hypothetical protein